MKERNNIVNRDNYRKEEEEEKGRKAESIIGVERTEKIGAGKTEVEEEKVAVRRTKREAAERKDAVEATRERGRRREKWRRRGK